MIIFAGYGTSPYNIKEHGGDMVFRSWLCNEKLIWVNCTGLVTESRYTSD